MYTEKDAIITAGDTTTNYYYLLFIYNSLKVFFLNIYDTESVHGTWVLLSERTQRFHGGGGLGVEFASSWLFNFLDVFFHCLLSNFVVSSLQYQQISSEDDWASWILWFQALKGQTLWNIFRRYLSWVGQVYYLSDRLRNRKKNSCRSICYKIIIIIIIIIITGQMCSTKPKFISLLIHDITCVNDALLLIIIVLWTIDISCSIIGWSLPATRD